MMERLGASEKAAEAPDRRQFPSVTNEQLAARAEEVLAGGGMYDEDKMYDYGHDASGPDAMTHLLMAYRLMMDKPECWPLLEPLMAIIHAKQELMTTEEEEEPEVEPEVPMVFVEETKEVREEGGQFCVYSTTGQP